jgi:DNA-binding beta-propeller fold protein YncE
VIYQNLVRIFNASGMEVFSFGEGLDVGQILDAAVDRNGDILLLSFQNDHSIVTRCNYRGVPIAPFEMTGLPAGIVFNANRIIRRDDQLYFVSLSASRVIITTTGGEYRSQVDLRQIIDPSDPKEPAEPGGVTVGQDGSLYITAPTLFRVFKRAPDGTVTSFGASGSAPGKFGVIAGIAVDTRGNVLIADKLKCVVLVFDKAFNFITEFGYRGSKPDNLIVPDDIAADGSDRVYVSQWRRRGVSVFSLALR